MATEIQHFLTQAREAGEIYTDLCDEQIIDHFSPLSSGSRSPRRSSESLENTDAARTYSFGIFISLTPVELERGYGLSMLRIWRRVTVMR